MPDKTRGVKEEDVWTASVMVMSPSVKEAGKPAEVGVPLSLKAVKERQA
jgi:hypothetical protein